MDRSIRYLPPEQYVYYTWRDPLKPREINITCDGKSTTIALNVTP